MSGTTAYVVNFSSNTLQAFNVANPASPALLGSVGTGSNPQSVAVSGTTAYVVNFSSNSLQAFSFPGPPRAVAVQADGTFASVAPPTLGVSGQNLSISGGNTVTLPSVTASNGLSAASGNITLGGTLTGATTLANGGNALNITGTGTTSFGGSLGIGTTAPAAGLHVNTPESGSSTALGVLLSGGTSGNPSIELRGSSKTPYLDFAETTGVDYSTRLISNGGTLYVNTTTATVPAFAVSGFTRLGGAAAAPAIATVKVSATVPTTANAQTTVALPAGIVGTKVLALAAMVYDGNNPPSAYPPNNGIPNVAGNAVAYQVYLFNNTVVINTGTTSSALFGKAINVLITYEQ